MNDLRTSTWRQLFTELTEERHCYEMGHVNVYQLANIIEGLVSETNQLRADIAVLRNRVYSLEGDIK